MKHSYQTSQGHALSVEEDSHFHIIWKLVWVKDFVVPRKHQKALVLNIIYCQYLMMFLVTFFQLLFVVTILLLHSIYLFIFLLSFFTITMYVVWDWHCMRSIIDWADMGWQVRERAWLLKKETEKKYNERMRVILSPHKKYRGKKYPHVHIKIFPSTIMKTSIK